MTKTNYKDLTLQDFHNLFYASGTNKFGGATEKSDHDFLIRPDEDVWDIIKEFQTTREDYDNPNLYSYKFHLLTQEDVCINLIIFKTTTLCDAWIFATDKMENFFENNQNDTMLIERKERHILFQTFVKIYLDRISTDISDD